MSRERITKALVDAQAPRSRQYFVWDAEVPGFGLRVRSSGGKHYVLRLRTDGRQRWYRIGKHGEPWTPDTARDEAKRVVGLAENVRTLRATGQAPPTLRHPIEARDLAKQGTTLEEFSKRYLSDYARPHKRPASVAQDEANLRRAILPALGAKRMDALARADVMRLHLGRKGTPTNANRCLALLSHMFTMAEKWGARPDGSNPCRHVDRFREARRERFLSAEELARLGKALAAAEKAGNVWPFALAAIRLLIFTGARASEILGLTWGAVDMDAGTVRLAESKTGAKTLYLNPPALAVLSKLLRVKDNPHVMVGGRRGKALTLSGVEQAWAELRRTAKLADVRLHDLRHSFASVAAAGGASLPIIGALLGHARAETTRRYAHLAESPLRAASAVVGRRIVAAMKGGRRRNVTPLRKRGRQ